MKPEEKPVELSITASLLAGILESALDAIITVNQQQEIVLFNRAAEFMFGWRRDEIMRQPLEKLIPQRFRDGHGHSMGQYAATGTTVRSLANASVMTYGLRANGEEFAIDVSISQVDSAGGSLFTAIVRDITERKLAEKALVDSEQRYAALFASAPAPMWVFDQAGHKFLKVNQAAVEAYGYSASEFLAMALPDIHADPEQVFSHPDETKPAVGRQGALQHRRKDGSLFFVDVVARPIQYAGQAACFVVALDTTAQVRAEKELQDHLFTLQRAGDAAQAITLHLTLEGMTQELSAQARGVIGASQASVSLAIDGDWAQAIEALSLSDEYAPFSHQLALPHGTGIYLRASNCTRPQRMTQAEVQLHPGWQEVGNRESRDQLLHGWLAVPLTGRDGRHIGLLQLTCKYEGEFSQQDEYVATELAQLACIAVENACLMQEVSQLNTGLEKKVAERTLALTRQEALFRALAQQAPQIIWTADPKGEVTYLNHAWFELMGGQLQDWTGRRSAAVLHPEDIPQLKANWALARKNMQPFSGLRRWLCKDGSVHTMAYRASPVLDEQGGVSFWVGIDADVTEFKLAEAALRRSNEELEAFSYSVSHDLRAPLSTINGFSSLLAKQLTGDANEKVRHYLARIQHGVSQMGSLIEDLLSLAKVSRTPLQHRAVDLSHMAIGILDEWKARQPERTVRTQIEPGLVVQGDEPLLKVAMENLLSNAWKFSARQADALISVGQERDIAGLPVYFVRDNGAGFDMNHAEKLFIPFERLHDASEYSGTGIGLATVGRVIGHHGGRLWAEAARGQGATFYFTLPRQTITA
ncbi:MAG: multi-sensor signal transduction histidine kinase [Polaromonas sp.]|nr:multi-sensor signal transduction histidine kinase [Polaromonas sp.]